MNVLTNNPPVRSEGLVVSRNVTPSASRVPTRAEQVGLGPLLAPRAELNLGLVRAAGPAQLAD